MKIIHMCLHNCLAHGLILLYKQNPTVQAYINEKSPECEYFQQIITAINEKNSMKRNLQWGDFILGAITYKPDKDNSVAEDIIDHSKDTLKGHKSLSIFEADIPVVTLVIKTDDDGKGQIINLPKIITETYVCEESDIVGHKLLIMSTENIITKLNEITKSFTLGNHEYHLKLAVRISGTPNKGAVDPAVWNKSTRHYITYAYEEQKERWRVLNDSPAAEEIVPLKEVFQEMTISMVIYVRSEIKKLPSNTEIREKGKTKTNPEKRERDAAKILSNSSNDALEPYVEIERFDLSQLSDSGSIKLLTTPIELSPIQPEPIFIVPTTVPKRNTKRSISAKSNKKSVYGSKVVTTPLRRSDRLNRSKDEVSRIYTNYLSKFLYLLSIIKASIKHFKHQQ